MDPAWEQVHGHDRFALPEQECAESDAASVAFLPLTGPAVLVSVVAEDGLVLGRVLDRILRWLPAPVPAASGASATAATAATARAVASTSPVPPLAGAVGGGA